MRIRVALSTISLLGLPATALAHPGHGSTDAHQIAHYLLEPVHVLALAAVSIGAMLGWRAWNGRGRGGAGTHSKTGRKRRKR